MCVKLEKVSDNGNAASNQNGVVVDSEIGYIDMSVVSIPQSRKQYCWSVNPHSWDV